MIGRLLMLAGPEQTLQVEDWLAHRPVRRGGILQNNCRFLEHPLGSQCFGPPNVGFQQAIMPFWAAILAKQLPICFDGAACGWPA